MADQTTIASFLKMEFPQSPCEVISAYQGEAALRYRVDHNALRPGGTVSGPAMMTLADTALYVAVLSAIGIVPLAVTTNLNISFLRKPSAQADLIAKAKLLKKGRTLAVGEVLVFSEGNDAVVAHVVGTYAIPESIV